MQSKNDGVVKSPNIVIPVCCWSNHPAFAGHVLIAPKCVLILSILSDNLLKFNKSYKGVHKCQS